MEIDSWYYPSDRFSIEMCDATYKKIDSENGGVVYFCGENYVDITDKQSKVAYRYGGFINSEKNVYVYMDGWNKNSRSKISKEVFMGDSKSFLEYYGFKID